MRSYASMGLQYSRGCPFDCEFCDISVLYGNRVRTKTREQVVAELESLHANGWRGDVFFVDDNFIGNKRKLRDEILPAITQWQSGRGAPFAFQTQASIDLADDCELLRAMAAAGFDSVFVGIETTEDESLAECGKRQNRNRDLLASVRRIQRAGLQVSAGFILGFDSDSPSVFRRTAAFVQRSGIVSAMVGLLNAPRNTRLYRRLETEGRLLKETSGDNTDSTTNFVPKMGLEPLIEGFRDVIRNIYSPRQYYQRVVRFLGSYRPSHRKRRSVTATNVGALLKSIIRIGVASKNRYYYWKLFLWTLTRRPRLLPLALTFAIYGFHYQRYFSGLL